MMWGQRIWLKLQSLFRRARSKQRLNDEIQFHLDQQIAENLAAGMSPQEARHAATRAFGNATFLKEETRDTWGWTWLEQIGQDLRYGLRLLVKNPSFTLVVVSTLALGIGATAALYSIFDGTYLHTGPLLTHPVGDTVLLAQESKKESEIWRFSPPEYLDIARLPHYQSFAGFFAMRYWTATLSENQEHAENPERAVVLRVTSDIFSLDGISPILGRTFTSDEDRPGGPNVAVISHILWNARFGRNPAIIGKTIKLNDIPYTIVGVTPRRYSPWGAGVVIPLRLDPAANDRSERSLMVAGKTKVGISVEETRGELEFLAHRVEAEYGAAHPEYTGLEYKPIDVRKGVAGDLRIALYMLMGAVALLALITSANISSLLLARTMARAGEIGTRLALGALPARLARQFFTESVLLSIIAGAVGVGIGASALKPLSALVPARYVWEETDIHINLAAFLLSISAALVLGVLFALAPVLFITRRGAAINLQQSRTRSVTDKTGGRMRTALVLAEMALAFVIIVGAGLMVRTYKQLTSTDFGFRTDHVLTMRIALPESKYSQSAKVTGFFQDLFERMQTLPGILDVAASSARPVDPTGRRDFSIPGRSLNTSTGTDIADYRVITPGYFKVIRTPLREGRSFTEDDGPLASHVAIVNERFAQIYFPNTDALGKQIRLENRYVSTAVGMEWPGSETVEIVGVAADSHQLTPFMTVRDLYSPAPPEIFVPLLQNAEGGRDMALLVRTSTEAATLSEAVRKQVLGIDAEQPVYSVETLAAMADIAYGPTRLCLIILGMFAAVALLTACIGLYAIVSYSVRQRTHEIGIRMALGAGQSDVLRLVARQSIPVVVIGLLVGLLSSLGLTRLMSSLVYGISANDGATLVTVSAILVVTAMLAVYLPARRAMRVDPMVALRYE
jgi:putative ABC transport system permease protein